MSNTCSTYSLTSFLHEQEEIIEELFPLGIIVDFVQLHQGEKEEKKKAKISKNYISHFFFVHHRVQIVGESASPALGPVVPVMNGVRLIVVTVRHPSPVQVVVVKYNTLVHRKNEMKGEKCNR